MKAAQAKREAIVAYQAAIDRMERTEKALRREARWDEAEQVHGYYNAAVIALWLERNDPPLPRTQG